jgi:hypothetical protein
MWNRTILVFAVAIIGLTAATPSQATRRLPKGSYVVMLTDSFGKEHRPGGISAARVPSRPNFPTPMRGSLGRGR